MYVVFQYLFLCLLLQVFAFLAIQSLDDADNSDADNKIAFDFPGKGIKVAPAKSALSTQQRYIVYCPCMGRFGNQADQFLGALAFAKGLNRTLVLPPWITYPRYKVGSTRTPFDKWFKVEPFLEFHRVVTMEKFMKKIAPTVWPPGKRIGFCYTYRGGKGCAMKEGNPFGPFWDHFSIDFDDYTEHPGLLWDTQDRQTQDRWNSRFPSSEFPVLAFMGAPGAFPVEEQNRKLQKYVHWSATIEKKADAFIKNTFPKGPYVGIHLRNGIDFENACRHVHDSDKLFASPQCIAPGSNSKLTMEMCLPTKKEVLTRTKMVAKQLKAKSVFVATDNDAMIGELTKALKKLGVTIHMRAAEDENTDPIVDLAILSKSDHFIGNCVSSFTSFVTRTRAVQGKPTSFWGFDE